MRCIRKKQKRFGQESETGSTGVKQNDGERARGETSLDSTPPPLRRTSGSSPPSRWEVLFDLFLDDLGRGRDGGFLDNNLDSCCLGTVDPDRGRELNGRRDGCNTRVRGSWSAKHW